MDVHQVRGARMYLTDVGKQFLGEGLEIWQGYFQFVRSPTKLILHAHGLLFHSLAQECQASHWSDVAKH